MHADPVADPNAIPVAVPAMRELSCYQDSARELGITWSPRSLVARPITLMSWAKYRQQPDPAESRLVVQNHTVNMACVTEYVNCAYHSSQPVSSGRVCNDQEIAAGANKWYYYATSSIDCAFRVWQSKYNQGTNISCCSTPLCNKPDPIMDNSTLVVQQPEPLSANLTCHMDLANEAYGPLAPHGVVFGLVPSSRISWEHTMMVANRTYASLEIDACARYEYVPCPRVGFNAVGFEDATCTPDRVGLPAWAHRYLPMYECMLMREDVSPRAGPLKGVSNVTCCNTDGCNAPLPEAATQQVLAAPLALELASNTMQCYESMQIGELISQDVARAVRPRDFDTSYVTLSLLRGWTPRYHSGDVHYYGTAFTYVCYSAMVDLCATDGKSCSALEAAAGVWEWQYSLQPLPSCWQQQKGVAKGTLLSHQHVTCCVSDLCNKPDPSLDPFTQVRNALQSADVSTSCQMCLQG
jgi:hypothetical protein